MLTPRWVEKRQHWRLDHQKNGERRVFFSSKPGPRGKKECINKCQAWLAGESDKSAWRLEKAWPLYLEDVEGRTGRGENYTQREMHGRLYILPRLQYKQMCEITEQRYYSLPSSDAS